MGKGSQTIGYRYLWSLQGGIGRGPVNQIKDITVGGLSVMNDGEMICLDQGGQLYLINKPELFGGDEKEGGVKGPIYFYNGARDQELQPAIPTAVGTLPDIAATLGGDVPNFRGVVTWWFDGLVCSLNPYPKEWAFRLARTNAGWWDENPWYPEKATIGMFSESGGYIHAMNAAHILYEINTNPEWGRGMPAELLDENSYIYAANTLCGEGLGLCLPWFRQETIKDFIPIIIDHIAGAQYVDRSTGKMTLRLIRNDYDPDDLPVFGPDSGLLRVDEDEASSDETAYNEIIVQGFDPTTKEDISVTLQNLASYQSLGEIISNTISYKGFPTRDLVARAAQRELKMQQGLRRLTCYFDRRAWKIAPAMPFKINMPSKGINNLIVRAIDIDDTSPIDGEIKMKVVQDVFAMPDTSFVTPSPPTWTPPNFTATPSPESRLLEVSYRDFYLRSTQAQKDSLVDGTSMVATVAKVPTDSQAQGYDLATKASGEEYEDRLRGGFTAWTSLDEDILPLDDAFTLTGNLTNFGGEFEPGMAILVDNEQMELTTFDEETGAATVKRGVADTIPAVHSAGATVWLIDDEMVSDGRFYEDGETVNAKVLTRTSSDLLPLEDATELEVEVDQRIFRPYPPGDVQIDALSVFHSDFDEDYPVLHPEPVLTLAHRDRLVQADTLVGHEEASIGPEDGVTYRVRVYHSNGVTLLNTYDFSGDTWTYEAADQYDDGDNDAVFFQIASVRDDLESLFQYNVFILLNEPPASGAPTITCLLTDSTGIGASSGTITWDGEAHDYGNWHDNSTNPSRITVPAGEGVTYARIIAQLGRTSEGTNSGGMDAEIRKNGSAAVLGLAKNGIFISGHTGMLNNCYSAVIPVTAGDYFESVLNDGRQVATAHNWFAAEKFDPTLLGCLLVGNNAGGTGVGNPSFPWVDTESGCYDPDGMWDSGQPTRVTIQADGWYRISASIYDSAPGDGGIYLRKNGAIMNNSTGVYAAGSNDGSGGGGIQLCTPPLYLTAGDYFEVGIYFTATFEYDVRSWICVEKCPPTGLRRCLVRRQAASSINSGNGVALAFDNVAYDDDGMFNSGVSTTNVTIPLDATRARVTFGSGYEESAGQWMMGPRINNANFPLLDVVGLPAQSAGVSATGDPMCGLGAWMDVAGGEVVTLRYYSENNRTGFAANEAWWMCIETD